MSMMHRGKVLAQEPPAELVRKRGSADPRGRVHRLSRGERAEDAPPVPKRSAARRRPKRLPWPRRRHRRAASSLGRVWAFARREAIELRHDPVRLAFAMLRAAAADGRVRLRHLARRREPDLRGARPRRDAGEPRPMPTPIAARSTSTKGRRSGTSDAELDRRLRNGELRFAARDPARLRARPAAAAARPRSPPISTAPCRSGPRRRAATSRARTTRYETQLRRATRVEPQRRAAPSTSRRAPATTSRSRASTRWCRATSCCC